MSFRTTLLSGFSLGLFPCVDEAEVAVLPLKTKYSFNDIPYQILFKVNNIFFLYCHSSNDANERRYFFL